MFFSMLCQALNNAGGCSLLLQGLPSDEQIVTL
jgi:hypothetical protein